jgi:predicted nucleic acid-binding protein
VKVYIDTSAFYALADTNDKNHEAASVVYARLLERRTIFLLSDHVLAETATLLRRRLGYEASDRFLRLMEESQTMGTFEVIFIDESLLNSAKRIFSDMTDPKLSLVDALSFSIMKKTRTSQYFAFDDHFQKAGFNPA